MEFLYHTDGTCRKKDICKALYLLTNGLGGYSSVTAGFSAPRADQGILVAAEKAPNVRINLVHRISEQLICGTGPCFLSSQDFADEEASEEGFQYLRSFTLAYIPVWKYEVNGVKVERRCCMASGENTVAVLYTIENKAAEVCTLRLTPYFKFAPEEEAVAGKKTFTYCDGTVSTEDYCVNIRTDGTLCRCDANWQTLSYPEDAKDGRPDRGMTGCSITKQTRPGETARLEVVFSTEPAPASGWEILDASVRRMEAMEKNCGFADPVARQLVLAADAYISHRDSTGGKTLLAGYPIFSDWGRDTMIALPGCCMATGRLEDAKSILRTFLAYEKDGLVPNLFPEGDQAPMYNTVDAALLLIDSVWQYVQRTGDWAFAWEAWGADVERAKLYSAPDGSEMSMVFQFQHICLDQAGEKWDPIPLDLRKLKDCMRHWQQGLHNVGWNSLFFNNHDLPRIVSRWGDDREYRVESAKNAGHHAPRHAGNSLYFPGRGAGHDQYPHGY